MKPSAATLLVSMVFVALAALGLVYARPLVASVIFTAAFFLVLASIVAANTCLGRARAYWRGFAVFSAAMFFFTLLIGDFWVVANVMLGIESDSPRPNLVTSYLLAWAFDHLCVRDLRSTSGEVISGLAHLRSLQANRIPRTLDDTAFVSFLSIGHSIFAILAGLLGGLIGSRFYRREMTSQTGNPSAPG
jgi:hypothetical protein